MQPGQETSQGHAHRKPPSLNAAWPLLPREQTVTENPTSLISQVFMATEQKRNGRGRDGSYTRSTACLQLR